MYFLARGSFVVVLRLNVVSTELAIASGTEFRSTIELAELIGPYAFLGAFPGWIRCNIISRYPCFKILKLPWPKNVAHPSYITKINHINVHHVHGCLGR